MKKDWRKQVIADAADQRDASYAALARWAGISESTLYKARLRELELQRAIDDARAGKVRIGGDLTPEYFLREILGEGIKGKDDGGAIYRRIWDHFIEINSGKYSRVLLGGGIGSGKTALATRCLVYQAAKLMSMDDPYASLGLAKDSKIVFVIENRTKQLAERNGYSLARQLVNRPKFAELFPTDQRLKSRIVFLKCPVEIWPTSADTDVLGMTVHSGSIDEANWRDVTERSTRSVSPDHRYDAAKESWEGLDRRVLSRLDEKSGLIIVSSSRRYRGEFLSRLEDELADDPRTYFFNETAWSINPEAFTGGEWFHVFTGDQQRQPRILADDEETEPRDRDLIVRVPQKFRRQFKRNITRSIQDLAGVAVERVGSYFTDRAALHDAACLQNRLMKAAEVEADAMLLFPGLVSIEHPESPRAVHGDLSLSGDKTGIAIAHLRGFDDAGRPLIDVDGLARILPPRHGQINLDSIFHLVANWKSHGVPIQWFSADGFQSADLLQRISRLGIRAGRLSVDMTSPGDPTAAYESLRLAIVEKRIRFPYNATVIDELLALEHDRKKNRVDHAPSGSKDLADALAGVVYRLSQVPPWQLIDKVPNAGYAAAVSQAPLGGQVTAIPAGRIDHMALVRASRGMPTRV